MRKAITYILPLLLLFQYSCKKFVEVDLPINEYAGSQVFKTDVAALSVVSGIYSEMMNSSGFASGGVSSITVLGGRSADEFTNYTSSGALASDFSLNNIQPVNATLKSDLWDRPYRYIYQANTLMEGLAKSVEISAPLKKQLNAEAKFIRGFCYFYLVNLFGDVPLALTTDYAKNNSLSRSGVSGVYAQVIADITDAQNDLTDDYSFCQNERVRPNKWAATALLARIYLYQKDWAKAEALSTSVINKTSLYSLVTNLNDIFLKNSNEAIWQLMPVAPGKNTSEAPFFVITGTPVNVGLSTQLMNAFDPSDKRRDNWVNSFTNANGTFYYPYKYKIWQTNQPVTEYSMVLRLAEQYLVRAEARAQQDKIVAAQEDLNAIRTRAGLDNTTANDKPSLLLAIEHERQVELFTEWGHRWFDLKRTNRATTVLAPIKGATWQATDVLYPIPLADMSNNPNLSQNPGY